jgi:hypothetical protein
MRAASQGPAGPRRAPAAALALALSACGIVPRADDAPMRGEASGQRGMLQYTVGRLTFLAPDTWEARGGERRVRLVHPENQGRLDVQQVERAFKDEKDCLADAEQSLAKGSANLTNVRRHGSTFARRRALAQEADQGGWHGWAWAVCDGGRQYRLFFAGRAPVQKDVLEAWRALTKSAAMGDGGQS